MSVSRTREEWQDLIRSRTGANATVSDQRVTQRGLTDWQEAVRHVAREQNISAAEAARLLSPVWRDRKAMAAGTSTAHNAGSRASRANQANRASPANSSMSRNRSASQNSVRAVSSETGLPRLSGLSRPDYQSLISRTSSALGTSASESAQILDPFVRSQRESRGLSEREWDNLVTDISRQRGVSVAEASRILKPFVKKEDPYHVENATVTISPRSSRRAAASPRSASPRRASSPRTLRRASPRSASPRRASPRFDDRFVGLGAESGFGMYEGMGSSSFPAGTPPESTDVVLSRDESVGLSMVENSKWEELRGSPRSSTNYLVEDEIFKVADSLGIDTRGLTRQAAITQIKERSGSLSPRSQSNLLTNQSPRSQSFLENVLFYPDSQF